MRVAECHLDTLESVADSVESTGKVTPTARGLLARVARDYVALQRRVNELERYLLTNKFSSPNDYVNVRDVLSRLA